MEWGNEAGREGKIAFRMKEEDREEIKPTERVKLQNTIEHSFISIALMCESNKQHLNEYKKSESFLYI